MKTRIYAAPTVKGLNQHWVNAWCVLGVTRFTTQ